MLIGCEWNDLCAGIEHDAANPFLPTASASACNPRISCPPNVAAALPQFLPPCRRDPLPRCPLLGPRPFASRTAPAESRSMHTACAVPSGRNSQVLLRPDFLLSGADRRLLRVSAPTDRCHSDKPSGAESLRLPRFLAQGRSNCTRKVPSSRSANYWMIINH